MKQELQPYILPFELALTRWAVVSHSWLEFGGDTPNITAFLAGWGARCLGLPIPENIPSFPDSFRKGWSEAECFIVIKNYEN